MSKKLDFKKGLALCLLACMVLSVETQAAGVVDSTGSVATGTTSTAGTNTCDLSVSCGTYFDIVLPKTISIDGDTKTANYSVTIEGDIAGTENLSVIPQATFTLSQSGKTNVTGTVTQTGTAFTPTEINAVGGKTVTGTVSASGLTAGAWTGSFSFLITYN